MTTFQELWLGRLDAYGTDHGGCERVPPEAQGTDEFRRRLVAHLAGSAPMGVYPMRADNTVHWGCVDWDQGDGDLVHAINTQAVLAQFGVASWIEASRSKGWHLWVFAQGWVPAAVMRRALLAACQIVDAPTKEINPKQETLRGNQVGNYVRLPYPGVMTGMPSDRQQMRDPSDPQRVLGLDEFLGMQPLAGRATTSQLQPLADLWVPPRTSGATVDHTTVQAFDRRLIARMSRPTYLAWEYGPRDGHDRSSSLARLVHMLREDGFNADEAASALWDADWRWGKHHARGDQDLYLPQIIERVY